MPPHSLRSRLSDVAIGLLIVGIALLYLSDSVADADLWGHLTFGQDILTAKTIPAHDTYSYLTSHSTWINHEWLSEVIFAAVYGAMGPRGLIALKAVLSLTLIAGSYIHLRVLRLTPMRAASVLLVLIWALQPGVGTIRPHLFTYVGFFAVLLIIHAAESGRSGWLWVLPVVFALWANLHGGFLAGAGLLAFWGSVRSIALIRDVTRAGRRRAEIVRALSLGAPLAGAALAILVNPYGVGLVAFLLRTATVPRPEIVEWAPLSLTGEFGLAYVILSALTAVTVASLQRDGKHVSVAILIGMALAPLIAARHLPLFALTFAVFGGPGLLEPWNRWLPYREDPRLGWSVAALPAIGAALCIVLTIPKLACIRLEPAVSPFPTRAIGLLKRSGVEGNLATTFNWGEFTIWHLGPRIKVSIDGRRETVYSDDVRRQALDFENGRHEWDAVLRAGADLAVVQAGTAADNLLQREPGWALIHQDTLSRVFVRTESPRRLTLSRTPAPEISPDGQGMCFPNAREREDARETVPGSFARLVNGLGLFGFRRFTGVAAGG